MIRAPPVLNFDFFKIQNKEDLRNGRQLLTVKKSVFPKKYITLTAK